MRVLLIVLLAIPFISFAQKDSIRIDTVLLTSFQETKLIELEKAINELKKKQVELIEFIFDSKAVQLDRVQDFKYIQGRIIYVTRLK